MSVTRRRRVQTEYSPGGLSVRLPWPPCRGQEHQATHYPPRASRPPPPPPTHANTSSDQGPVVADPGTHPTSS